MTIRKEKKKKNRAKLENKTNVGSYLFRPDPFL